MMSDGAHRDRCMMGTVVLMGCDEPARCVMRQDESMLGFIYCC